MALNKVDDFPTGVDLTIWLAIQFLDGPKPEILISECEDSITYAELLWEKGYDTTSLDNLVSSNPQVASFYFKRSRYDVLLAKGNADFLLSSDLDTNEIVIDMIIKSLLNSNQLHLLASVRNIKLLLYKSKQLDNKMIIEYCIDNLRDLFDWEDIHPEDLLCVTPDNIPLIQFLINKDCQMVANMAKKNPKKFFEENVLLSSILQSAQIYPIRLQIELDIDTHLQLIESYVSYQDSKEVPNGELSFEALEALRTFRDIMMSDGKSNKEIVDLGCRSFRRQFLLGFPHALRDLYSLINIKRKDPNFVLKFDKKDAFNEFTHELCISDMYLVGNFDHESTHAIHYLGATNGNYPVDIGPFYTLSPEQIRKMTAFAEGFRNKEDTFNQELSDLARDYFSYNDVSEFSSRGYKEMIIQTFEEANKLYPPEYIKYLSDNILSADEYLKFFQRQLTNEVHSSIFHNRYMPEMSLIDIFDALSKGNFFDEYNEGKNSCFAYGHGSKFYSENNPLSEIIANFATIIKSSKSAELIGVLKDIMGKEFVDLLNEFYNNLYAHDESHTLKGGAGHGL